MGLEVDIPGMLEDQQNKGQFIAIEGIDASGKRTQTQKLAEYLKSQRMPAETISFPQYDKSFYGKITGAYLRGEFGSFNEVSPHEAAILYAADRFEAAPRLKEILAKGSIIISDRYTASNQAFQGAKLPAARRPEFYKWLSDLEFKTFGIPKPDINILLKVPVEFAYKLQEQKAKRVYTDKKRDINEVNAGYLGSVLKVYEDLSQEDPSWVIVECVQDNKLRSIEDVHKNIIQVLRDRGFGA